MSQPAEHMTDEQRKMSNTIPGQMAEKVRKAQQRIHNARDSAEIHAGLKLLEEVREELECDAFHEAVVLPGAKEIADDIIKAARSAKVPVVWVTGNSYVPPARSFPQFEYVYQHVRNENSDTDQFRAGMASGAMWEEVERLLAEANVCTEVPEFDNSIYAVDLARWEFDDSVHNPAFAEDDINSDWHPRGREETAS